MSTQIHKLDRQIKSALAGFEAKYSESNWHEIEHILLAKPKETTWKKWAYPVNIIIGIVVLGTVGILVSKNIEKRREFIPEEPVKEVIAPAPAEPKKKAPVVITKPVETDSIAVVDSTKTETIIPEETNIKEVFEEPVVKPRKRKRNTEAATEPVTEPSPEDNSQDEMLLKDVPIIAEPEKKTDEPAKPEPQEKKKGWKELLKLKKSEEGESKNP